MSVATSGSKRPLMQAEDDFTTKTSEYGNVIGNVIFFPQMLL